MALVCALFLMLATAMVAMPVARVALASLASSERERDRAVARAAAEAALRDGERALAAAVAEAADEAADEAGDEAGVAAAGTAAAPACGPGGPAPCGGTDPPPWQTLDLAASGDPAVVPYGAATGARMAVGGGLLPARLPAYVVERLAPAGPGAAGVLFRITAIGFGTRASTQVVLQSLYRRPASGAAAQPAGRIGWREIANWPALHARATH